MTVSEARGRRRLATVDVFLYAGALLTLAVGAIHLQQYAAVLKDVPTIGSLFLLNAAGAGAIAAALGTRLRALAAVGGIGLSAGALVAVLISLNATLFGYTEPSLRPAVTLSIVVETAAIVALVAFLGRRRGSR